MNIPAGELEEVNGPHVVSELNISQTHGVIMRALKTHSFSVKINSVTGKVSAAQ